MMQQPRQHVDLHYILGKHDKTLTTARCKVYFISLLYTHACQDFGTSLGT